MFGFRAEKPISVPLTDTLTTGFLGKLPDRADYVHCSAGSREVQALDGSLKDWLSLQAAHGGDRQATNGAGVGFLQVGGHDRQGLVGYVFPSQDSHGRLYPFFYFSRWSDTDLYFKPAPLFFAGMQHFGSVDPTLSWPEQRPDQRACEQLRAAASTVAVPTGRHLMKASLAYLTDISLQRWLNHMVGGDPEMQMRLLAGCRTLIAGYRSRRHRPVADLELPLGPADMAPASLVFWLHVLTPVGSDNPWRPDVLWSLNPAGGKLWVLARPLAGSYWQHAFSPAPGSNWSEAEQQYRSWAEQMINQPQLCLLDVAIRWSQME